MEIENYVSNDFLSAFVDSINVFDCRLPGVIMTSVYFTINNFSDEIRNMFNLVKFYCFLSVVTTIL